MSKEVEENKSPKSAKWLVPTYPPLRGDDTVGNAAVEGQLIHYPKVVRTMTDPPLVGQRLSCISFMLFKESRKLSNGVPVYGYVKMRGNWADESQAIFEASKIIKEVDSKYQIRVAPTGAWVPITDEQAFVKDQIDVQTNKEEILLRGEAAKEKMAEEKRVKREIREREEELKNEGDIYDDQTSLTYYSMRRVTEKTLLESYQRQINQLESTKKILMKVQRELKKLELDNSEYTELWVDRYNEERRKAGIPDYVPSEQEENAHVKAIRKISLDDSEDENDALKPNDENDVLKPKDDRPSFFKP